jgi:hypothetical protein
MPKNYRMSAAFLSDWSTNQAVSRLLQTGSSEPRTRLSQYLGEIGIIVLLCACILAPQWEASPTQPKMRRELFVLIAFVIAYGWMLLAGKARKLRPHAFYIIAGLFSVSVTLSIYYGVNILHHDLSIRDFTEIPKAWLPVLYFTAGYEVQLSESGLRRLLNFLGVATIIICLFGWAQYLNWRIAALLMPYYGDGGHNDYALQMYHRVYSTLTNPNVLSQFLSWTMIAYTLALVFQVGSRLRNVVIPAFCLITIVLSGSRYGILSAAFGFLLVLGLAIKTRRGVFRVVSLVMLFVLFSSIFMLTQKGSYIATKRFDELRNPMQVASLRGRLDLLWVEAIDYFLSSPVIGHGPAKNIFRWVYTDSEYLDILKWYGAVGFVIYLSYYCWPMLRLRKGLKDSDRLGPPLEHHLQANLLVTRFGFVALWMALFMNIGMFTCFNWYIMGYLWLWTGISVRAAEVVSEAAQLAAPSRAKLDQHRALWPSWGTLRSRVA